MIFWISDSESGSFQHQWSENKIFSCQSIQEIPPISPLSLWLYWVHKEFNSTFEDSDWLEEFLEWIDNWRFYFHSIDAERNSIQNPRFKRSWIRADESISLVLYQSHRCHLQVGLPRQIPFPSLKNKLIEELNGTVESNRDLLKRLSKTWRRHSISIERHLDIQEDQAKLALYLAYLKEIHPKMNSFVIVRH